MEASLDPKEVERAKSFWAKADVDQVFDWIHEYLGRLKTALKRSTATDKECVQGWKLTQDLDWTPQTSSQDSSVVQVVIGSDGLLPAGPAPRSPSPSPSSPLSPSNGPCSSVAPPAGGEENSVQFQPHTCSQCCLSSLPSMPQSTPPFWGQNPLKVPLLCGFKRLTAKMMSSGGGVASDSNERTEPAGEWDVTYRTPCGQSLGNHDDVMRFLVATGSYDVLQVDFFTFNPSVRLDPPESPGPRCPELDLSRGVEPTPVELCSEGGARPADFRYRKERWPHGCFLSRGPALFSACCDCSDGCSASERCACVAMTTGGRHYSHLRLEEPVPSGVFECGPWCGCDRARCQNRLVQRGIRVRLQVFQTDGRGWGVRCRDDLDRGTFVCMYAGVILQKVQTSTEPSAPKLQKVELPSDDEVEVVTEWLAPPVLERRPDPLEPTSPPLHVPVIQRPADAAVTTATPQDRDKTVLVGGPTDGPGDQPPAQDRMVAMATPGPTVRPPPHAANSTATRRRKLKVEDVNFLDASKEGNVSRFINHSCQPNLFIQNVFTDSHDPAFPVIAFFTSRAVAAGTELTWNYSADTYRKQEVDCLCGSDGCRGNFTIEENLCSACEDDGEAQ
ncbi:uncharacterized protein V6R79_014944 [Siganus canaliculatus]